MSHFIALVFFGLVCFTVGGFVTWRYKDRISASLKEIL